MKIILLDDSKTVLFTLQLLLEENGIKKEEIYSFSDGEKALSFIKDNGADIIFTDIQMPGMDGYEFAQKLFELSNDFRSSLIVVSAGNDTKETSRMESIGARYFINKPIDSNHFNTLILSFLPQKLQLSLSMQENLQPSFSKNKQIDLEAIAMSIGIGVKYIPRLLNSFISESLQQLDNYKLAISTLDYDQIEHSAHAIKGSAGNMRFDSIYKKAKLAEIAGHLNDKAFDYQENYNRLKEMLEEVAIQIKTE